MNNQTEFYERQTQKQWWLCLLLIGLNVLFIVGCIQQLIFGKDFGNNPLSDVGLCAVTLLSLCFSAVMLLSKLETVINSEGIHIHYTPFQLRYKQYAWKEISRAYTREYCFMEYGGTGIRSGRHGKAYIVSGKYGLQVELKNGKKIFIGSLHPEEIDEYLKALENRKNLQQHF